MLRLIGVIGATTLAAAMPAAARAACTLAPLLELKVTMRGTRPMVPVTLNGHEEHLLVDSGAFYSNLSPGKAAELGLRLESLPIGFTVRGVGGDITPSATTVKTVALAGVQLKNIQFVVGGSEIGSAAGLLGQNVLGIGDVEYDLAHGVIRLMRARDCKNTSLAYWAAQKPMSMVTLEPTDQYHHHTIGAIWVNGVKMRAVFDTGASGTVLSLAAAARIGLKPGGPDVRPAGYSSGIGSHTVAAYLVPIDSIKLGDGEEVKHTHLRAEPLGIPDWDMLIGGDFFRSHRVYVANGLHKLFFTYDGGPIFNLGPTNHVDSDGKPVTVASDPDPEPTYAAGYSRAGAAAMARRDYAKALADFDKACTMAPTDSSYFYQRAQALLASRQPMQAMDDLDHALRLDPANVEARLLRASGRLARRDRPGAEEDVASVDQAVPPAADARLALGGMYNTLAKPAKALAQYDVWLRYHGDDSRKPAALNGRCWARAQLGTDLGKALSDCNAAIKGRPGVANFLDSRGLVRLKMGDNTGAIDDYDAALALQPKMALALYARGVAKQRSGDKAGGDKDMAAAVAIDAGVTARAKTMGLGG